MTTDPFMAKMGVWTGVFMRCSVRGFLRYSKESGLSMPQIGALFRLSHGNSGVTDLGGDLGVTSAAASQMLDKLFHQELILRSEDPDDRRAKKIVLTEKGKKVLAESFLYRQQWLEELSKILSADEKKVILSALDILITKSNQLKENA
jgi:DNA-binding MarR family transcriptional regulator